MSLFQAATPEQMPVGGVVVTGPEVVVTVVVTGTEVVAVGVGATVVVTTGQLEVQWMFWRTLINSLL